jgi:Flp pilus assembly protein TadD
VRKLLAVLMLLGLSTSAAPADDNADCANLNAPADRSIVACTSVILGNARAAWAYAARGRAHFNKDDNDRAIADFSKVIELNPNGPFAYSARAAAYINKGDNDRAIADHNEVIRLDPKNTIAFVSRGFAYGS